MGALKVRPIEEDELALFSALLQEVARDLMARGLGLWPPEHLTPERLLRTYAVPEMRLGLLDGQAAATMILQDADPLFWPELRAPDSLFVHKVAVKPALAGRGLAAELLRAARVEALSRGKTFLRLDTAAERPKLRALYEGFGFRLVDERDMGRYVVARYALPLG